MTESSSSKYVAFMQEKKEIQNLKAARTRCWGAWAKCLGLGVFGAIWQSVVTENWKPTGIATVVALPCLVLAGIDSGFTVAVAPPVTAAALFTAEAKKQRAKHQFLSPEQADMALVEKGIY